MPLAIYHFKSWAYGILTEFTRVSKYVLFLLFLESGSREDIEFILYIGIGIDGFTVHEVQLETYMPILFQSPGVAEIGFQVLRLSVNLKELGKVFASNLNFQKLLMEEILQQIIIDKNLDVSGS